MNSVFGIVFSTKKTFRKLDDEFSDILSLKTAVIFFLEGTVTGAQQFISDRIFFQQYLGIWAYAIFMFLSGLIGLLFGRYIISPIVFVASRALKGDAEFIDIVVVVAYASIPRLLVNVPMITCRLLGFYPKQLESYHTFITILHVVSFILSIKIIFQGLKEFNGFGIIPSLLSTASVAILPIAIYFLGLLAN